MLIAIYIAGMIWATWYLFTRGTLIPAPFFLGIPLWPVLLVFIAYAYAYGWYRDNIKNK